MTENIDKAEVIAIREAIERFLNERLNSKLEKEKKELEKELAKEPDEIKRSELELKARQEEEKQRIAFRPNVWILDAARRSKQLSFVTHAAKFTHPDAKGSSIFMKPYGDIGTGIVATEFPVREDVVGNAAALDVYKFLSIDVDGQTLLDRVLKDDQALLEALGATESVRTCLKTFKQMAEISTSLSSHTLAKQLYWPLNEGGYHLLSPLFPTSLVQRVYEKLSEDRFGEKTKTAREAKKNSEYHEQGYCDYPDLLIQKYGGTKPQNISQLNSNRRGENWLLCAMPPLWKSETLRVPLYAETVFGGILRKQTHLHKKIKALVDFLKATDSYTNVNIRDGRTERVSHIIDEVLQWSFQVGEQVGWSRDPNCRLIEAEICWLDPVRAQEDELPLCKDGAWANIVSDRFAHWFNAQLSRLGLTMSDQEYEVWKKTFLEALNNA